MPYSGTDSTTTAADRALPLSLRRPGAVARSRRVAGAFLQDLEPDVPPLVRETVALVVSELVTNALRHAGGACVLRLKAGADHIDVFVHDSSSRPPRLRTPDLNGGAGGFGWPMIHRLATEVEITYDHGGGKTVCARLSRNDTDPALVGPG
ncbi:ATP-binding protein [Streptomyces sp. NPDC058279]|uniref:ATP-binding protein n=1 Tax=Streptomyces sp. NPDC058279 TaxID=3346418 RepID=UPI0036E2D88E